MHFDFDDAITFTSLASSTFHVETEPTRPITPNLCLGKLGKKIPNVSKNACIRRRIGAWRPAYGGLIDINDFVYLTEKPI